MLCRRNMPKKMSTCTSVKSLGRGFRCVLINLNGQTPCLGRIPKYKKAGMRFKQEPFRTSLPSEYR